MYLGLEVGILRRVGLRCVALRCAVYSKPSRVQHKQVALTLDVVVVKSKGYQRPIMNERAKLVFVTYVVKTSI